MNEVLKPHKVYAECLDEKTLEQFHSALRLDCVERGALMADAHFGYTVPIGSVYAVRDYVFPSFVGYDIGCGMCAVPTSFEAADVRAAAKDIFDDIYETVPVGFAHNQKPSEWGSIGIHATSTRLEEIFAKDGLRQLCSLGGGNHFIEIGADSEGIVWIIVHSGSRGIGHAVASHYMRLASGTEKAKEGHFGLHVDSMVGQEYLADLRFCLAFALENRRQIAERVASAIFDNVSCGDADLDGLINRNHNHAEQRDDLWIHRKGATHAEAGMKGVIPGNMRDGSFIVRGKGNPEALWSSSHGAGRVLGRKEAQRVLTMDKFRESMVDVVARITPETLDESPFAYKDIFNVMAQQEDLVEVVAHVKPIINIKG